MGRKLNAKQIRKRDLDEAVQIMRQIDGARLYDVSCPTFALSRDERDSPRGLLTLIRLMLEKGGSATATQTKYLDRYVGHRSASLDCPGDDDFRHLIEYARVHLERAVRRTPRQRFIRNLLLEVLSNPVRLKSALRYAHFARPVRRMIERAGLKEFAAMLDMAPKGLLPTGVYAGPGTAATKKERKARVILAIGSVQQVMRPEINDATIRLLARRGVDVKIAPHTGCSGIYATTMGRRDVGIQQAKDNIDAWMKQIDVGVSEGIPIDAIIVNASSSVTTIKDYPYLLRHLPDYARKAQVIAELARDITDYLKGFDLGPPKRWSSLRIALHSACAAHHGHCVDKDSRALLRQAGFAAVDFARTDQCCGASGGFNMLQPELAAEMRGACVEVIEQARPDFVASGDIDCITHLAAELVIPIVHTIELLDWAYGGPIPRGLEKLARLVCDVPGSDIQPVLLPPQMPSKSGGPAIAGGTGGKPVTAAGQTGGQPVGREVKVPEGSPGILGAKNKPRSAAKGQSVGKSGAQADKRGAVLSNIRKASADAAD